MERDETGSCSRYKFKKREKIWTAAIVEVGYLAIIIWLENNAFWDSFEAYSGARQFSTGNNVSTERNGTGMDEIKVN